eukprot:Tamp_05240.p1 GENE.Tamp_05240~~Tamp_05240.p1  ORF type:complete len:244 (-),score=51.19 Tamp_05240:852-1583(-)
MWQGGRCRWPSCGRNGRQAAALHHVCMRTMEHARNAMCARAHTHLRHSRRVYGVDFVVSAIGVEHVESVAGNLVRHGGAIQVDGLMRASVPGVYAAGDACSVLLPEEEEKDREWFQMRLWSQARAQGMWAAYCMLGLQDDVASPLELFAHATQFFGQKVVLLGRFNGQGLDKQHSEYQELVRTSPGHHYVKAVLFYGRLKGAVLLGETDLEETFENLILNRFDLRFLGEHLLDPDLDLEDYFD